GQDPEDVGVEAGQGPGRGSITIGGTRDGGARRDVGAFASAAGTRCQDAATAARPPEPPTEPTRETFDAPSRTMLAARTRVRANGPDLFHSAAPESMSDADR